MVGKMRGEGRKEVQRSWGVRKEEEMRAEERTGNKRKGKETRVEESWKKRKESDWKRKESRRGERQMEKTKEILAKKEKKSKLKTWRKIRGSSSRREEDEKRGHSRRHKVILWLELFSDSVSDIAHYETVDMLRFLPTQPETLQSKWQSTLRQIQWHFITVQEFVCVCAYTYVNTFMCVHVCVCVT